MATFYSRYVPGSNVISTKPISEERCLPSKKRKVEDEQTHPRQAIKKSKTTIRPGHQAAHNGAAVERDNTVGPRRQAQPGSSRPSSLALGIEESDGTQTIGSCEDRASISGEPSVTKKREGRGAKFTHREGQGFGSSRRTGEVKQSGYGTGDATESETGQDKKKKRKKTKEPPESVDEDVGNSVTQNVQHRSIRSKFEKAKKKIVEKAPPSPDHDTLQEQNPPSPPLELHGLEPLPQPSPVEKSDERPTFSSLPPWLANPLKVDSAQSTDFSSLALDPALLENVKRQGLERAFSVQSAVIPLLTDGPDRHPGDICISAATGSGKTLAYILPVIQHLSRLATTKLRAVIIVPTRELVRQAREVCESSAAGMNIRIGTSLGSKSLNEEQAVLVEKYEVYDPEEYRRQQDAPVDWSKIDLGYILSELEIEREPAVDFVTKYRSKVDVLICTPGRLVDHIRSTKGFNLDDVHWLVVDEADRLLNESFQEWIDVVMPALESRAARALQDSILRHMRLELPDRIVRKVIMSATLTQDISKLNSLRLRNPRLVVVGDAKMSVGVEVMNGSALRAEPDEAGTFNLPSTLVEYAVPVGDEADKPLYLLELLRSQVNVFNLDASKKISSNNHEEEDEISASDSTTSASVSESESAGTSISSSGTSPPQAPRKSRTLPLREGSGSYPNTALIFTRSAESATRLSRLLSLLSTPISSLTATLTKSSASSTTRKALNNFRQHKIRIIIATDRASRGLDLPSLGHVISYDVPNSITTYVHRVGRTARARKGGSAWTLLAHREARWFWNEIGKGTGDLGRIRRNSKVQRFGLDLGTSEEDGTRERYDKALKTLGEEVLGQGRGRE